MPAGSASGENLLFEVQMATFSPCPHMETETLPSSSSSSVIVLSSQGPRLMISRVHAKLFQSCPTLRCYGPWPARFLCPWDSPGKNPGVGCHFLLQGIFPTYVSNPHLPCILSGRFFTAESSRKPLMTSINLNYLLKIPLLNIHSQISGKSLD